MRPFTSFIAASLLGIAACSIESPLEKRDVDVTVSMTIVKTITSSAADVNTGRIAAAQASADALASIASMFTALPSVSTSKNYQLAAASAAASAASADTNASESAALMSIASLLANSPTADAPVAAAPTPVAPVASPPASRVPDISAAPAAPAAQQAMLVAGHGTDANGDQCGCQCLCGSMPMPANSRAGIGAFGGLAGALPAGAMAGKPA